MKHSFRFLWNVLLCLCPLVMAHAEDGSDRMENLIYSPRYFGPNAFPMPTLRDGQVSQWYEAELRGEYHAYTGDKTWDLRGRLLLPFFRGRAGVEIDWCFKEKYKMTPETRDERFAAGTEVWFLAGIKGRDPGKCPPGQGRDRADSPAIFPQNHFTNPLFYGKIAKLPAPRIRESPTPTCGTGESQAAMPQKRWK